MTRAHQRAQFKEYHVLGYREPEDLAARLRSFLAGGRESDSSFTQLRVVGNSGHRLLVDTGEQLQVVDVAAFEGQETEIRPGKLFRMNSVAGHGDDILCTYPMGASFLVETFNDVRIVEPGGVKDFVLWRGGKGANFPKLAAVQGSCTFNHRELS